MKVTIYGAGKVGRALAAGVRRAGWPVTLRAARRRLPRRTFDAALLVIAVRDPEIERVARMLADRVTRRTAVVHVAGARGPEALAPLVGLVAGVGQAHPMLSFAADNAAPKLKGAHMLVSGDAVAVQRASRLARALGMVPRDYGVIDRTTYHAAAGLVANGAAALAAAGARLLELSGVPRADAPRVLGPLLSSVAENVERLGLPHALTGPVRRGDAAAIAAHLQRIREVAPELVPLYRALVRAQVPLARALGEADRAGLRAIAAQVDRPR
jgi:predicted short-subunit dehydrogenase-like oxidoreductase (DUF2520 family)